MKTLGTSESADSTADKRRGAQSLQMTTGEMGYTTRYSLFTMQSLLEADGGAL